MTVVYFDVFLRQNFCVSLMFQTYHPICYEDAKTAVSSTLLLNLIYTFLSIWFIICMTFHLELKSVNHRITCKQLIQ